MSETAATIRDLAAGDLGRVFEIYNYEVTNTTSTFETVPKELGRDDGWMLERPARYPVLVAEAGADGELIGWGSLSQWSPRGAYARTVEVSVYVDRAARGHGYGKQLLAALIERAPSTGAAVLLARVAGENPASIALHESLGFKTIGTQRRSGQKFGRILDVALMDLHLDE